MDVSTDELVWNDDVLPGFRSAAVGDITLVRPLDSTQPDNPRAVVLHVHGRNDYFFQSHLAEEFLGRGLALMAVDMRRAGRSLQVGDLPHHVDSIDELADDIDVTVRMTAALWPRVPVIIHAHSTGGLAATVWAARQDSTPIAGMILNSPHFGLRMTVGERLKMLLVPAVARLSSTRAVATASPTYATHQHRDHGGRWDFDTAWKRINGDAVTAGWLAAVRRAHRVLSRGVTMPWPVLVARSDSTGPDREDNPRLDAQDTVVDVDAIARMRTHMAGPVQELVVADGVHDLCLSPEGPRQRYFEGMADWLDEVLA